MNFQKRERLCEAGQTDSGKLKTRTFGTIVLAPKNILLLLYYLRSFINIEQCRRERIKRKNWLI